MINNIHDLDGHIQLEGVLVSYVETKLYLIPDFGIAKPWYKFVH